MHSIHPHESGRWEVALLDGDLLTIDTRGGLLVSIREGSWSGRVQVDQCEMGQPIALTVTDSTGTEAPWFGAEVASIRSL